MKIVCIVVALLSMPCFAAMNLVLLGPPGGGKGTLARELQARYKIPHISSGDIVRAEIAKQSEFGKMVQEMTAAGQLLPDGPQFMGALFELLKVRLQQPDCKDGFILDGTPRTAAQAQYLEEMLKSIGKRIDEVILLDATKETLVSRLAGRLTCSSCNASFHITAKPPKVANVCDHCGQSTLVVRPDDTEATVLKRIGTYEEQIAPILAFYRLRREMFVVDANREIASVSAEVFRHLEQPYPRGYLQDRIPRYPHATKREVLIYNLIEMFKDVGLVQYAVDKFARLASDFNVDYIAAPEARALPIFGGVMYKTGKPGIMLRKPRKIPDTAPKISRAYTTAYSSDTLEMTRDPALIGKKVLLIDDGISSGGTTAATVKLLEDAGMTVVHIAAIVRYRYRGLCEEFLSAGLDKKTTTLMDLE